MTVSSKPPSDVATSREQQKSLDGSVAVVTGATGGIGRGIALTLASRGATVVVGGRDDVKGAAIVRAVENLGGQAEFETGDVRSIVDMRALCERVMDRHGRINVVVANAGGNDQEARRPDVRGPFSDIDLARVTGFVSEALSAKLNVVQAAIPHLRSSGGGSVVFVTSEGGRVPTPTQTAMAAASGGLIVASKVLAKELAPDRIRVNCVGVTLVKDSPSWDAVFASGEVSERHRRQYERVIERSPLGVAAPADIGKVVAFLASEDAALLTGATVSPTGGLTVH